MDLYRSIPHNVGLTAPVNNNNQLNNQIKQQISGTAKGTTNLTNTPCVLHVETTWKRSFPRRFNVEYMWCVCKCAPIYACIFMGKVETEFLETQRDKPFWWVSNIDNIFFIWANSQEKLKVFLEDLNKFHPNLKFTSDSSEENVAFLDLKVKLKQSKTETDLHVNSTNRHQYLHILPYSWNTLSDL